MIIATKSEDVLKKQGIFLDTMKKFPLEPEDRGLVVKVDTSMGPLRLEINTGATLNMARASSIKAMNESDHQVIAKKSVEVLFAKESCHSFIE